MNRKTLLSGLIASAFPSTAKVLGESGAAETAQARREIEALIRISDAAVGRRDINGVLHAHSPDFQGQEISGHTYDRARAAKSLAYAMSITRAIHPRSTVTDVTLTDGGETALVMSREHTVHEIVGRKTGRIHKLKFEGEWSSLWSRKSGAWQIVKEKQLEQSATKNGVLRFVRTKRTATASFADLQSR